MAVKPTRDLGGSPSNDTVFAGRECEVFCAGISHRILRDWGVFLNEGILICCIDFDE
jgi:hypothetical protein